MLARHQQRFDLSFVSAVPLVSSKRCDRLCFNCLLQLLNLLRELRVTLVSVLV